MHQIRGSVGPSPISDTATQPSDGQTTTVQAGESKLSDVAKRLNTDANALQQANPNISDDLKVGQQINLPQGPAAQAHQDDDDDTVDSPPSSELPPTPLGDPMAKNFMQDKLDASGTGKQTGELHASDLPQASGGDLGNLGSLKPWDKGVTQKAWKESAELKPWDKDAAALKPWHKEIGADTRKDKLIVSEASHKDSSLTQVPGGNYPSMAEKGEYMKWQSGSVQGEFQKYGTVQGELKKVDVGESSQKPSGYDLVKDKPA